MFKDPCGLSPRNLARGVLPHKVSDLENDANYIPREELEDIVGVNYRGKSNSTARVIVNNTDRTIEVLAIGDDLKSLLPKDDSGNYVDGDYVLSSSVKEGQVTFRWVPGTISESPYYYGNVDIESTVDLTESDIIKLNRGGIVKGNQEFRYISTGERQVLAYPALFGKISKIEHVNTGFNVTGSFDLIELTVSGVPYYAYISQLKSTGDYTYRFIY